MEYFSMNFARKKRGGGLDGLYRQHTSHKQVFNITIPTFCLWKNLVAAFNTDCPCKKIFNVIFFLLKNVNVVASTA